MLTIWLGSSVEMDRARLILILIFHLTHGEAKDVYEDVVGGCLVGAWSGRL